MTLGNNKVKRKEYKSTQLILIIRNVILFSLNFFLIAMVFSTSPSAQETKSLSLEQMHRNLTKIRKSTEETKKKIKIIRDARFLPELYFALAEFYIDEAKYLYLIKVAENKNAPVEELDFASSKRLKVLAIKTYNYIIEKFPKLEERDKAIFLKAHEFKGLGRFEEMVRAYGQLVREYPKSPYWEESQVTIGNYFLDQKKDIDIALDTFKQVTKRPLNPFTPIVYYKMGWIYINKDSFYKSLLYFEKAIKVGSKVDLNHPSGLYKASDIRREALLAMVWPYSELTPAQKKYHGGKRKNVISYFYKLSPDSKSFQKVLLKLGHRLTLKKNFIAATKVYFEALRMTTDLEKRIDIIERAYVSMKNTQKDWPLNGFVEEIISTLIRVKTDPTIKKSLVKKVVHDFEIFSRDVSTRQQQRAKRLRSSEAWKMAIRDYEKYLWAFPKNKNAKKIRLNLAESYFNSNHYLKAAQQYAWLARHSKKSNEKKSYLDSSIQSYISSIRNESSGNLLVLNETRYGFRRAGRYFMKKYPKNEAVPGIIFNIAQTYYDERNLSKAVSYFKRYIRKYPDGKNVKIATHLILDSFNQVEDFKGLIRAGKWILAQKSLQDSGLKNQVRQIVQQADLEKVLSGSQDIESSSYTNKLLKLASKYKGSKLGDEALFQAFVAFKAKKDPRAYESGEQLVLQHGKSKYAQEVTNQMVQMALTTADFRRAAIYLELFNEKYPRATGATEYLKNAASIRESMGEFSIAARNYAKLGNYHSVAKMDFLAQNWSGLKKTARKAKGIYAPYWEGLALYRLKGPGPAQKALTAASQASASDYKEKEAAAHALYLLSRGDFEHYRKIKLVANNEAQSVNDKSAKLRQLEEKLNKVIEFGNGRWAIAGLQELGNVYKEFAKFIYGAPTPSGLSSTETKQYAQEIRKQAKVYEKTANQFFQQCLGVSSRHHIFTDFVKACQSRGKITVNEASETKFLARTSSKEPKRAKSIRRKLIDSPQNVTLLSRLTEVYIRAKDFSMAELILHRALEIKKNDATLIAKLGSVQLYKNDPSTANEWFKKALSVNKSQPLAILGMAGLYKKYGYKKDFLKYKTKVKPQNSAFVHPMMQKVL